MGDLEASTTLRRRWKAPLWEHNMCGSGGVGARGEAMAKRASARGSVSSRVRAREKVSSLVDGEQRYVFREDRQIDLTIYH